MDLETGGNDPLFSPHLDLDTDVNHPLLQSLKIHMSRESGGVSRDTNDFHFGQLTIPKVPEMYRTNESSAEHYTPAVVSIGPYHYGSQRLAKMEEKKTEMAAKFIKDSGETLERFHEEVARHTFWVMGVYTGDGLSSENLQPDILTSIMLRDGCFILEFIWYVLFEPARIPMSSQTAALVKRDLFLLENQLPFRIIYELMALSDMYKVRGAELIDNFITHMRGLPPAQRKSCRDQVANCPLIKHLSESSQHQDGTVKINLLFGQYNVDETHLLGILREKFIQTESPSAEMCNTELANDMGQTSTLKTVDLGESWYTHPATELKQVGIECEPAETGLFKDIEFTSTWLGGKLKLPRLSIQETTVPLFLNLVVYEASLGPSKEIGITPYVCFMSSLIHLQEDVRELRSKEILFHNLGSDQHVVDLFNDIANNLVPNPNVFREVKEKIKGHYKNYFKTWYNYYNREIYGTILKIAGFGTAIFGALKVFVSLSGLQIPAVPNPSHVINGTLYY